MVRRRVKRAGQSRSAVVEQMRARALAGAEVERIWETSLGQPLTDEQAAALAYSELGAARKACRPADR